MPLPFYLLLPDLDAPDTAVPLPLVICPHGHNQPHIYVGLYNDETERLSIIEGERDIARRYRSIKWMCRLCQSTVSIV